MIAVLLPLLAEAAAARSTGVSQPDPRAPSSIVAAAPAGDWVTIAADDLLVMELAPDTAGRPRRVVIQLMPAPFSQGWVQNIRLLARTHWWDGLSVNRVQDDYVAQWGDAEGESAHPRALPRGLRTVTESDYATRWSPGLFGRWWSGGYVLPAPYVRFGHLPEPMPQAPELADPYARFYTFIGGMAFALTIRHQDTDTMSTVTPDEVWPVHCYAMVGVGRNLSPDTGTGAELYAVIGHAPRHLDRNIALVGRVVEGIEFLSSLPRGTEALGFYRTAAERTAIVSVRLVSELPAGERPRLQYLSTESASFAAYAIARANRHDAFFIRPAAGADVCNIPVPVRRVPAGTSG